MNDNLYRALTAEVIVKASRVSQIGNCDIEETELVKTVCRENMDYCPPVEAFDGCQKNKNITDLLTRC